MLKLNQASLNAEIDNVPVKCSLVQILRTDRKIEAAGFLVTDRHVLTCAHVVENALGINPTDSPPAAAVPLVFPFVSNEVLTAEVHQWFRGRAEINGDVAVLQLQGPAPPGARVAGLSFGIRRGQHFETYGFPTGNDRGSFSRGRIVGSVADRSIQLEASGVAGYRLQAGFSGAPVWDQNDFGVLGMISDAESDPDPRVGFMIRNSIIAMLWSDFQELNAQSWRRDQLRDALLNAFPTSGALHRLIERAQRPLSLLPISQNEMAELLAPRAGIPPTPDTLENVIREIVYRADKHRQLEDLLDIARKENPTNSQLRAWETTFLPCTTSAADDTTTAGYLNTAPAAEPVPIVGRDEEIDGFYGWCEQRNRPQTFVVHGIPGSGKSELVNAIAHELRTPAMFPDGVLWAPVSKTPNVSSLLDLWTDALKLPSHGSARRLTVDGKRDTLRNALGERQMLLVLDDVWDAADARQLFVGGSRCVHLVTTRITRVADALSDAGEAESLHLDDLSSEASYALLARFTAGLESTPEDEQCLRDLVALTGHLPLAIRLIGTRIRDGLRVGQESGRAAMREIRASTVWQELDRLNAAIDTTKAMLPDDSGARRALHALSAFPSKPNTFSIDAALAVSASIRRSVLSLVEVGLVEISSPERLTMHRAIAESERKDDPNSDARARMVEFYVRFMENHRRDLVLLNSEATNLFSSLQNAYDLGLQSLLVRGAAALGRYLDVRGHYGIAEDILTKATQAAEALGDNQRSVEILGHLGRIYEKRGDYLKAEHYLSKGLDAVRALSGQNLCDLLHALGIVAFNRGEYAAAEKHLREGLAYSYRHRQEDRRCHILQRLALLELCRGNQVKAKNYADRALRLAKRLPENEVILALLYTDLARISSREDLFPDAEKHANEGLRLARTVGLTEAIVALLQILARVERERKNYRRAHALLEEAFTEAERTGHRWYMSFLQYYRGRTYLAQIELGDRGHLSRAQNSFARARRVAKEIGSDDLEALALFGLSGVARAEGDSGAALKFARESHVLFSKVGHYKARDVEAVISELNALLASPANAPKKVPDL